jgi:transcriptional regulator with XRE-family HTH domain
VGDTRTLARRFVLGRTLAEAARAVGVHRQTMYRYTAGRRRPSGAVLHRMLLLRPDLLETENGQKEKGS